MLSSSFILSITIADTFITIIFFYSYISSGVLQHYCELKWPLGGGFGDQIALP